MYANFLHTYYFACHGLPILPFPSFALKQLIDHLTNWTTLGSPNQTKYLNVLHEEGS